jgi:enamine deaminase RidA (YjgF/YER057c/UK114 family)
MPRQNASSGSPFEGVIGFSRASRLGRLIAVSGMAPIGAADESLPGSDAYAQAKRCLDIIGQSLQQLGAGMEDVLRTRVYLVRREDWESVARAHREVFEAIRPASSFIVVSGLLDPGWLVEIEADAVVDAAG